MSFDRDSLIEQARIAAKSAYAPYSKFPVGAALAFDDGSVVTGANMENASFGLSLCAETVAAASAMNGGKRGGLVAVAVAGDGDGALIMPCGRCRQVLYELAQLGGTDPVVLCEDDSEVQETRLSRLLPDAFGPDSLA